MTDPRTAGQLPAAAKPRGGGAVSGIAAAGVRGKKLGRQSGQRPKSDRLAPKVLALVAQGRSYRLIGREVGLSKNTMTNIVKRSRAHEAPR